MYAQTVKIALEKFRVCFRINYNMSQYARESSKITNITLNNINICKTFRSFIFVCHSPRKKLTQYHLAYFKISLPLPKWHLNNLGMVHSHHSKNLKWLQWKFMLTLYQDSSDMIGDTVPNFEFFFL
jgi:hypothetical protein